MVECDATMMNAPPPSSSGQTILSIPAKARVKRELSRLQTDPPPGIAAHVNESDLSSLTAQIEGPKDSPFGDGVFSVRIRIPSRYPFEPPQCRFVGKPPYHPNIDGHGRICLDTLKSPPSGTWSPAVSLPSLLLSLQALLGEPNPDDGLEPEISNLYKHHPEQWREKARQQTLQHNCAGNNKDPLEASDAREKRSLPETIVDEQDREKESAVNCPKKAKQSGS